MVYADHIFSVLQLLISLLLERLYLIHKTKFFIFVIPHQFAEKAFTFSLTLALWVSVTRVSESVLRSILRQLHLVSHLTPPMKDRFPCALALPMQANRKQSGQVYLTELFLKEPPQGSDICQPDRPYGLRVKEAPKM